MATLTTFLKLLKPEKNDYVDVEKHISENYDKIDTEFSKIDTKFKNYVPTPVGGILFMYNNTNPAELYPGTTWEELPNNKFIKTGSTPLQQAGSNNFTIQKTNLPAVKVQLESFSVTTQPHKHNIDTGAGSGASGTKVSSYRSEGTTILTTLEGGGANTGTASPYTQNLGSSTPISINPEHITVKAWKRLT